MNSLRFKAIHEAISRTPLISEAPSNRVSDFFGKNVFGRSQVQRYVPESAFKALNDAIEKGTTIDRKTADEVASGMKTWALENGVTHYTHWFQPLTGSSAEKHDVFMDITPDGRPIEKFSGSQLAQQEPDASSFPSGGIRNTFEARGYTAWDPSSPAFIFGKTLCIPTIYLSYTGEALDYKTPLLKTLHALDKAATAVCQYFDKNVKKVHATLGWEQEYFLVDSALYNARPDLIYSGRTLMGATPPKGQQLEDHYFGSIPERVNEYMRDFETEAYKLGIPLKTRHNEVAPHQYEVAPIFEEVNIAVDHNMLLMDLMDKVARRHNLNVLFHEKPFAGINGSGKHNNWSMSTDTGINLLSPGKTAETNLMFLTFFVNVIKAVHEHSDLLRAAIASAGNDHRLGANEAPPAIISVFIGSQLTHTLDEFEKKFKPGKLNPNEKKALKLDLGRIPEVLLDNTDRNRTSPFAFTGNKFEFRAVGSSANCSQAMITLNTIVTHQLTQFKKDVDKLTGKSANTEEAIVQVLHEYIVSSKNIRFEGNNYSKEWVKEAEKRGLSNIQSTPAALEKLTTPKAHQLFETYHIFNKRELEARHEIQAELFTKKIQIESRIIADMALTHVIPSAIKYQNALIDNVKGIKEIFGLRQNNLAGVGINDNKLSEELNDCGNSENLVDAQLSMIRQISERVGLIRTNVEMMIEERKKINQLEDSIAKARYYGEKVKPYFDEIRYHSDKLEILIDDSLWPFPKYRELLFVK
ncbi:MAG: glutamine synthetase type III [Bacteroidia bacterium]|nr:glutamine synthetase type III [Bacteroidia bacterium]